MFHASTSFVNVFGVLGGGGKGFAGTGTDLTYSTGVNWTAVVQ